MLSVAITVGLDGAAAVVLAVLLGILTVALTAAAIRTALLRVEIDTSELVTVNWFATVRRPLTDVRYFTDEGGLVAVLRDGTTVQADVFGPWFLPPSMAADAAEAVRVCQGVLRAGRAGADD